MTDSCDFLCRAYMEVDEKISADPGRDCSKWMQLSSIINQSQIEFYEYESQVS